MADASRKLFGTDGVRGEAGTFLTAELATSIGRAATASPGKDRPPVLIVAPPREAATPMSGPPTPEPHADQETPAERERAASYNKS